MELDYRGIAVPLLDRDDAVARRDERDHADGPRVE